MCDIPSCHVSGLLAHFICLHACRADLPHPWSLAKSFEKVTSCHTLVAASFRHSDKLIGRGDNNLMTSRVDLRLKIDMLYIPKFYAVWTSSK